MNTEQLTSLYEKLELKSRRGRGGEYTYIPWQDVADKMNKVFGGNWSSEVKSETVIGSGVVLRVRVTVIDTETNLTYYHEGYGGADISGAEVGTVHKSAYSKALRDACKKWGPGLYTDEDGYTAPTVKAPIPAKGIPAQQSTTVKAPTPVKSVIPNNIPQGGSAISTTKATIPFVGAPTASIPSNTVIPIKDKVSAVAKVASVTSIPGTQKPIIPTPAVSIPTSLPPVASGMATQSTSIISTEDTKINDVQMAALDGILELKDIDPNLLIKEAFEEGKIDISDLPTKEMLSYQQAVLVIKYGNEKFRK